MRNIFYYLTVSILFLSCKKESNSRVDIYALKTFELNVNQTATPATLVITNAVPEDKPIVSDNDIEYYTKSTSEFKLNKDISSITKTYGRDKAFVVTVNKQPVYYGVFHPAYLSSMSLGVATIDPILFDGKNLKVQFIKIEGNSLLQKLDKRNDSRITNSLKSTGRLR
jgi:hypothetical protein